jgi:hypothetical protein
VDQKAIQSIRVKVIGCVAGLIGGRLKAHVGHEVEIIGITSDARLNSRDALSSAIGSSKHERTTLTVESVKMLAAKCR